MNEDPEIHDRLVRLTEVLLARTREGKISWKPTDDERAFLYTGPGTSALITSHLDEDGDNRTTLSVLNSRGTEIESIENEWQAGSPATWNETLDDLYYSARRDALNIDKVLDNFLATLEQENGDLNSAPDEPPF